MTQKGVYYEGEAREAWMAAKNASLQGEAHPQEHILKAMKHVAARELLEFVHKPDPEHGECLCVNCGRIRARADALDPAKEPAGA